MGYSVSDTYQKRDSDTSPLRQPPEKGAAAEYRQLVESLSPSDWRQASRQENAERQPQGKQLESTGVLPDTSLADGKADLSKVLLSDKSTAQEKLKAVETLAASGIDHLQIKDKDGSVRDLRLELEKAGARTLVHLYAADKGGREHVLLRGISNGDGTYTHETNKNGHNVSFYGSWWETNMRASSALAVPAPSETDEYYDARGEDVERRLRGLYRYTHRPDGQQGDNPAGSADPAHDKPRQNFDDLPVLDQSRLNDLFDQVSEQTTGRARRIEGLPGGAVYFRAGMQIDADGSPRARQIDPTGQTSTSLRHDDGSSVNAERIPYFVLPAGKYKHLGIKLGDIAAVRYNGKVEFAVFADVGPSYKLGEGSMALARELGINNHPVRGGISSSQVEYLVFPGSGDRSPGTHPTNRLKGADMLYRAAYHANLRKQGS